MCVLSFLGPMRVGHTLISGVCNTATRSTALVSGVRVGHFGENGPMREQAGKKNPRDPKEPRGPIVCEIS